MPTLDQRPRGLEQSPFARQHETRLFFPGATHREALARLRFLRANHRLGLLAGDAGLGKSLVLRVFHDDCRRQGAASALLNLGGLSTREFYGQLATQLGATVRHDDDLPRLFRQTADRIAANRLLGTATVALLDDVHEAGPDLLGQLLRLARLDVPRGSLTIVLAARDPQRLGEPLRDLVDLRIDLEPWDELDTVGYLQMALVDAGSRRPLFDDESLGEIHRLASGVPRQVIRLAEHALLLAASFAPEIIDTQAIRAAHAELTLARA